MKRFIAVALLLVPSGVFMSASGAQALGPVCMEECRCAGGQQSDLVVDVGGVAVCVKRTVRVNAP